MLEFEPADLDMQEEIIILDPTNWEDQRISRVLNLCMFYFIQVLMLSAMQEYFGEKFGLFSTMYFTFLLYVCYIWAFIMIMNLLFIIFRR